MGLLGRALRSWIRKPADRDPDRFLREVSGVIHVGANVGQERETYDRHGLRVLWLEPTPPVFEVLKSNIEAFPRQRVLECLVTDRDDAPTPFHIANNNGESSSILELKEHKDIWPNVAYLGTITLKSITLASLLRREGIDPARYDALVMDTQGSELLVLHGAEPILRDFKYIKTEAPDFEWYAGCCRLADIEAFLTQRGYEEFSRVRTDSRVQGGSYYNIVYRRKS